MSPVKKIHNYVLCVFFINYLRIDRIIFIKILLTLTYDHSNKILHLNYINSFCIYIYIYEKLSKNQLRMIDDQQWITKNKKIICNFGEMHGQRRIFCDRHMHKSHKLQMDKFQTYTVTPFVLYLDCTSRNSDKFFFNYKIN